MIWIFVIVLVILAISITCGIYMAKIDGPEGKGPG